MRRQVGLDLASSWLDAELVVAANHEFLSHLDSLSGVLSALPSLPGRWSYLTSTGDLIHGDKVTSKERDSGADLAWRSADRGVTGRAVRAVLRRCDDGDRLSVSGAS